MSNSIEVQRTQARPEDAMGTFRTTIYSEQAAADYRRVESRPVTAGQPLKRALDLICTAAALIVLAPLLLAIAVMIKATSAGPVLYGQERVGLNGRTFRVWKFRSMVDGADKLALALQSQAKLGAIEAVDAPAFKSKSDPRVTPLGRHLRRMGLDELPQLWNVLVGEMSLVGPRPLVVSEDAALPSSTQQVRRLAKPGITCTWQIAERNHLSFDERIALDLDYVSSRSMALDVAILARTPAALVRGDGAY